MNRTSGAPCPRAGPAGRPGPGAGNPVSREPRGATAARQTRPARPAQERGSLRAVVVARSVAALLSVLLLAGSGWGWYLVRVAEASVSRTDAIPGSGNADVNGGDHAGEEMNLLLVGMDSRDGLTPEQQAEFSTGDPEGVLNTDSMMLVHLPADGSGASFVSLPRDTYVTSPAHGEGRLNSAYARGYNETEGTDAEKRRRRRPVARPDGQPVHRPADRPLRRDRPARLHQPQQHRRRRRGQPLRGDQRPPVRRGLPRRRPDDRRGGRAEVRAPAARAAH